jgi:hypothetical protein
MGMWSKRFSVNLEILISLSHELVSCGLLLVAGVGLSVGVLT